jgi:hypothetical protein
MSTVEGVLFVYGKLVNDMLITKDAAINVAQRAKEQGKIIEYWIDEESETTGKVIATYDPCVRDEPSPIFHVNPEDVEKLKAHIMSLSVNHMNRIVLNDQKVRINSFQVAIPNEEAEVVFQDGKLGVVCSTMYGMDCFKPLCEIDEVNTSQENRGMPNDRSI